MGNVTRSEVVGTAVGTWPRESGVRVGGKRDRGPEGGRAGAAGV